MPQPLPDEARDLFDGTNFVTIATVNSDGGPQTSIVWAKLDGDDIVFSTIKGRRKHENLVRHPRVSAIVFDPADPYHYAEVRGAVTIEDDPGGSMLQELARKYTGGSWSDSDPANRVIVRISPDKVIAH
ncbi:PPOX class F420-dependent oxidoreductase [Actinomadura sp. HBU206391]|uniref:PPOX class F420-dependent oxidoreductase n=1 Tax=Actinomadura sp. HBU206391 TaxID=2731692 RepID=UPI00164F6680|nr:PPOX class F420-dependent oxidoreductase [Actinomadura sp. HBU206391]MBC6459243.1 PPOX class F420-dependent oxidoreductase [Actinomadura sp. HBU206391]